MSEAERVLYPAWYSLYSAYLYNMMFMDQAYKMCKEGYTHNLTPSIIDNRITEIMRQISYTASQQSRNVMRRIGYRTKRAGFIRRLLADLIDQLFVSFILVVSINSFDISIIDILNEIQMTSESFFDDLPTDNNGLLFNNDFFIFMVVVSIGSLFIRVFVFVYEWISVWLYATTIGKYLTGLYVVDCLQSIPQTGDFILVKPGLRVSCFSAFKRSIVKNSLRHFVPLILCFVKTRAGRTLYDETTKTAVVLKRACWEAKFEQARQ